ncbi:MAG: GtrA family protein [Patescibacteria group bacterium]
MLKKDYIYAGIIGLITAVFVSILLPDSFPIPKWTLFVILPIGEYVGYVLASSLFSHILFLKQLGRFGIVGLMNFSVDTGIAIMLRRYFEIPAESYQMLPLFTISFVIAVTNSYFWQRIWTFAEKDPPTRREFIKFLVVTLIGMGINTLVAFATIQGISSLNGFDDDMLITISKIAATAISLFWNFLGYKFIVFRE